MSRFTQIIVYIETNAADLYLADLYLMDAGPAARPSLSIGSSCAPARLRLISDLAQQMLDFCPFFGRKRKQRRPGAAAVEAIEIAGVFDAGNP